MENAFTLSMVNDKKVQKKNAVPSVFSFYIHKLYIFIVDKILRRTRSVDSYTVIPSFTIYLNLPYLFLNLLKLFLKFKI